jgi:hypothetical protein
MNARFVLVAAAIMGFAPLASAQPGYYAPPPVYAPAPPPPPHREIMVPPPGPPARFVWDRGHHEWNGRVYFWVPGHYIERPEPGLIWIPGRWGDFHGQWRWIGGHWHR